MLFLFLFWFLDPTDVVFQCSPHPGGLKNLVSINIYNTHTYAHFLSVLHTNNTCIAYLILWTGGKLNLNVTYLLTWCWSFLRCSTWWNYLKVKNVFQVCFLSRHLFKGNINGKILMCCGLYLLPVCLIFSPETSDRFKDPAFHSKPVILHSTTHTECERIDHLWQY